MADPELLKLLIQTNSVLEPGVRALLSGLSGRPELNGLEVRLLFYKDDRWAVECSTGERIKVKPRNLAQHDEPEHERLFRVFHGRLAPNRETEQQFCSFDGADLLRAVQAEVPDCQLLDYSDKLNVTSQRNHATVLRFIATSQEEVMSAAGSKLIFVQRTKHNAENFFLVFAISKYQEELGSSSTDPINIATPGWLAWVRDDYFFSSPEHDFTTAGRMLTNFATGLAECCICLEPTNTQGPSTALHCGHVMHNECLLQAVRNCVGEAKTCPLCREPLPDDMFIYKPALPMLSTIVPTAPPRHPDNDMAVRGGRRPEEVTLTVDEAQPRLGCHCVVQ